jgi:uncharacterized membrane protein
LSEEIMQERRTRWRETAKTLKKDEQKIYEEILDSDGIVLQSELVEKTELSKSTVSRCLDALEGRGMIERKRKGMSNLVLLK